jgi:hypothetical protein
MTHRQGGDRVARVVVEMYRIENVIYVRIKAITDQRAMCCSTAQLLSYQPRARLARMEPDDLALESVDPLEPVHG